MTGVAATLRLGVEAVEVRRARAVDVPAIVALLADDPLGGGREVEQDGDLAPYRRAFQRVDADPGQLLVVATAAGRVVATLQLTVIPGLSRRAAVRGQVEAVRVHGEYRGRGLGSALVRWVIGEARRRGCALLQLTTDRRRTDAHRFYARLGFTASHDGLKLLL